MLADAHTTGSCSFDDCDCDDDGDRRGHAFDRCCCCCSDHRSNYPDYWTTTMLFGFVVDDFEVVIHIGLLNVLTDIQCSLVEG